MNPIDSIAFNFASSEAEFVPQNKAFMECLSGATSGSVLVYYEADQEWYDLVAYEGRAIPAPVLAGILGLRDEDYYKQLGELLGGWFILETHHRQDYSPRPVAQAPEAVLVRQLLGSHVSDRFLVVRGAEGLQLDYLTRRGAQLTVASGLNEQALRELLGFIARENSLRVGALGPFLRADELDQAFTPALLQGYAGYEWCPSKNCEGLRVGRVVSANGQLVVVPEGDAPYGTPATVCDCIEQPQVEVVLPMYGVITGRAGVEVCRRENGVWRSRGPEPVQELGCFSSWGEAQAVAEEGDYFLRMENQLEKSWSCPTVFLECSAQKGDIPLGRHASLDQAAKAAHAAVRSQPVTPEQAQQAVVRLSSATWAPDIVPTLARVLSAQKATRPSGATDSWIVVVGDQHYKLDQHINKYTFQCRWSVSPVTPEQARKMCSFA